MKKAVLLAPACGTLLLLAACNSSTSTTGTPDTSSSSSIDAMTGDGTSSAMTDGAQSSVTMDQNSTGSPPNAMQHASSAQGASASADAGPPSADARVIDVAVESFKFMPNVIAIKKGEKVVIHLKGLSGSHGFMVADLGINVPIAADETKDVTIPTDKAETFSFRCSVPCGPGHRDMRGTITIS